MTPEQKKNIDDFLKQMGSNHTSDHLEAIRKRAVHTLEEWCAQDRTQHEALPQEVKDMQMLCRYFFLIGISGIASIGETFSGLDMAVEAAYNLGKANKPKASEPQ